MTKKNNNTDKIVVKKEKVASKKLDKNKSKKKINNKKNNQFSSQKKIKNNFLDKPFSLGVLDIFIIVIVVSLISCVSTGFILNYQYKKETAKYLDSLKIDDDLNEIIKVYNEINDNYYENLDKNGLINSAINGMLTFLNDKYSVYMDSDLSNELSNNLDGSYNGVGISFFGQEIVGVYDNSPAAMAGLKKGDLIVNINGNDINDKNVNKIADFFNNTKDEKINISIKRNGTISSYILDIENVDLSFVDSKYFKYENNSIGYIKIDYFSSKSYEQFFNHLKELEEKKIDSLILDLRNNGGGYLSMATDVAKLFLEKDKVIYYLDKKNEKKAVKDSDLESRDYPIVILMDTGTASASEMLVTALKDSYNNTVLVGEKTFGKGTVQNIKTLRDGSMFKYTVAKWLRPNGNCVDNVGIEPDYLIYNDNSNDKQLEKALDLLK